MSWRSLEIKRCLAGYGEVETVYPLRLNQKAIARSLQHFIDDLNGSRQLIEVLLSEAPDQAADPSPITLYQWSGLHRGNGYPATAFYFDGQHSLILANPSRSNQEAIDAAVISFSLVSPSLLKELTDHKLDPQPIQPNDLIILQLQGPTYLKPHRPVLSPFRWEVVLTCLVSSWACSAGFPRILMQPGENSHYFYQSYDLQRYLAGGGALLDSPFLTEHSKRLIQRHNFTAKKCGFRRSGPNQPYIRNFW